MPQHYSVDFSWLGNAVWVLGSGLGFTILLTVVTAGVGTAISVLLAAVARSAFRLTRIGIAGYIEVIRNTPFLAQLFFVYFALPGLGIRLPATAAALLALTLNYVAYCTETIGAGIDAVPPGQREAAQALGLRPWLVFYKVVLPQALVVIYPALTSLVVVALLESAAVSQIAVPELTYEADLLQTQTFRALETFSVVAVLYFGLSLLARRLMWFGGRWLPRAVP